MLPKITPNLNFTVVASAAAPYLRGVGTAFANPGLESSVPVYLDDTYLPRASAGLFDFNDLARIEVLKGPQGTLYGRNATGGAIRLITNDPQLEYLNGSLTATFGSDARAKIGGVVNLPFGEKIALRLSAIRDQDEGYLTDIAPSRSGRVGDRNEAFYLAKLLFQATDALSIKITSNYSTKNDNEGITFQNVFKVPQQIGQALGGCVSTNFYNLCNDDPGFGDHIKSSGVTGRVDYDIGSALFSSISSYETEDEQGFADIDATGADLEHTHSHQDTRQLTQEFQVTSKLSGPLKYVVGLYYLHERSKFDYDAYGAAIDEGFGALGTAVGLGADDLDFRAQGPGLMTNSIAPYAQVDYDVTDRFTLTGGVRYTVEKKTLLQNDSGVGSINPNGYLVPGSFVGPITGACTTEGQSLCEQSRNDLKFNKFTPKLTLSYKADEADLLYVTASRGFKSGGFNLPAFGYVDRVNPEILDDLEVGWKHEAGALRSNSAAFFYNYRNLQVQVVDPVTAATFDRNGANAHIYGVEEDLTWRLTGQLELGTGAGYLHAKYTSFPEGSIFVANFTTPACAANPAACLGNSFPSKDVSGFSLVNAPDFTGYFRSQFTQPVGAYGSVILSAIENYRSKTYFDVGNQVPDAARALLSARIQWLSANEKYSVAAYGENLTGKEYYLSRTLQAIGGFQVPAPPRQGFVTLNVKF